LVKREEKKKKNTAGPKGREGTVGRGADEEKQNNTEFAERKQTDWKNQGPRPRSFENAPAAGEGKKKKINKDA